MDFAWQHLGSRDRFIRWAARTAIEHQPLTTWSTRALSEKNPAIQVEALLGLARAGGISPPHRKPSDSPLDHQLGVEILKAWANLDPKTLDNERRLTWARTVQIVLHRFEITSSAAPSNLVAKLDPLFPSESAELNALLCETLVYLQSPTVASKALALMRSAPTQEEQIEYARSLRALEAGWTPATRNEYFTWFLKAANFRGGASFSKFIEFIRNDALDRLPASERKTFEELLEKKVEVRSAIENFGDVFAGRTPRDWTLDELAPAAERGMNGRNFNQGRKMFGAGACYACHRFGNEGGMTGPDLTGSGGRYSPRDLLDQILNPSKEINEQFVPSVLTKNDGSTVVGSVVNLNGDNVMINSDLSDPNQRITVDRKEVKSIEPSKISPMPPMLLSSMTEAEILDLVAYILSGGNRDHEMFRSSKAP